MNIAQVEKVRKLVKESKILSNSERQEWLALLELMNDKQVWELERILENSQVKSIPQVLPPKVQPSPVKPPLQTPPALKQVTPKLPKTQGFNTGHILNMPKLQNIKPSAPPHLPVKPTETFTHRLEVMVKEPELPPPYKDLKLDSGVIVKSEPKQPGKISLIEEVGIEQRKIEPAVRPGLEKWPEKYNVGSNAAYKSQVLATLKPNPSSPSKPIKITSLSDIRSLVKENFFDPKALEKALKEHVRAYGYIQVLMNLEKSELYKSYIKTGQEVLQKATNFEALLKQDGDYMNKKQFEDFTDMLRFIQSE